MRNRANFQSDTPEAREREYWRTIVRNVLVSSAEADNLRGAAIDVISWKMAKAIMADLNP